MKLSALFIKDAMDLDLKTTTKSATLRHMAEKFSQAGGIKEVEPFLKALEKREEESTTGVGDEIAMPHAQDESVRQAAIIFARSREGIDWASLDGQPVKYIFMIAAPAGASDDHLQALASLSRVLLKEGVKDQLDQAQTPEDVVEIMDRYDEKVEEEETGQAEDQETKDESAPLILAVTACPTGIAHTYMAEEKLKQAGQKAGIRIKVETNGQSGVENRLTRAEIQEARAIIVAADREVEMARFDGKPLINVPVSDGINKADELVDRASHDNHIPIYHAKKTDQSSEEEEAEVQESLWRKVYKHLMNGISHMLPFVVAGGMLIAVSFFWGINSANPADPTYSPLAQALNTLGNLAFAMMLPVLSGYIGESMAGRTGLVIGMMGGVFADPTKFAALPKAGIMANVVPSGFLGALVAGFLTGAIVKFLEWAFSWLPKSLNGLKSIFLYPVLGVLIMGLLMIFVVNRPMGWLMNTLVYFINSIPSEMTILLGFICGAMMSIDMGGPINKAAYVTGTALVTASGGAGSNVMAAVMVGGMVPPLAIAISTTTRKDLYSDEERSSGLVNYVMAAAFITEGAIPFAAKDPIHVIPPLALGAGIAGALSMAFGCVSYVPHGGVFAVAAGGVTHPLLYLLAWIVGGLVGAVALNFSLGRVQKQIKASE